MGSDTIIIGNNTTLYNTIILLVTINTIHYNNIIGSNTPIIGNNTTLHTIETLMVTIQHYYYYIVGKNTTLRDTIILGSDYMTVQYRHA